MADQDKGAFVRVDGTLHLVQEPPKVLHPQLEEIALPRRDSMVGEVLGLVPRGTRALACTETCPALPTDPRPVLVRRGYPLGFWGRAPRRQEVQLVTRLQHVFRGTSFVLPTVLTDRFKILDLRVRYWSQFGDLEEPPVPRAHDVQMSSLYLPTMQTAAPGEDISLIVENLTEQAQMFMGALVGIAAW